MLEEKTYIFDMTSINGENFSEQVSLALQKRTELVSRAKMPKLWAHIDRLNAKEKASEAALKKHRVFRKILGVINLLLGVVLFVPGLMDPKELLIPLLVGAFAIFSGLIGIFAKRGNGANKFLKPAKRLLQGKDSIIPGENQIIFSECQMEIKSTQAGSSVVPYADFEYIIETNDAFLLTYRGYAALLKKEDLHEGDINVFCSFIALKTRFVPLNNKSQDDLQNQC